MENIKMMSDAELLEAIENAKENNENWSEFEDELSKRKELIVN